VTFGREIKMMTIQKPSSEVAFATGWYILFGAYGTYMGIRDSSLYMTIMCPLLVVLSCGVWLQYKVSAWALITISIAFTLIGAFALFFGKFSWSLVIREVIQIYTSLILWLWTKGIEI